MAAAHVILKSTSNLPAIHGRVRPQESQCGSKCVWGIKAGPVAIGRLEQYVEEWGMVHAAHYTVYPHRHAEGLHRGAPPPYQRLGQTKLRDAVYQHATGVCRAS